jgi:protein gp37
VRVSEGCTHCFAEAQSHRNPRVLGVWGATGTRVLAVQAQWKAILRWDRLSRQSGMPRRVFCASLGDVLEAWDGQMSGPDGSPLWHVTMIEGGEILSRRPYTLDDARSRLWELIRATPHLTWQILTKRPENLPRMMPAGSWNNVWLGTSVESQEYVWRLDALQEAPQEVPVRFCSAEPLLGSLDLRQTLARHGIGWVIIGGESGGGARPCEVTWVRDLVHQCREADVACFVKQFGTAPIADTPDGLLQLRLRDRKGGNEAEWPEDLRVREFPGEAPSE